MGARAMDQKFEGLAALWEQNKRIRKRFRNSRTFLSFPAPPEPKEDDPSVMENPICMKSLNQNVHALTAMFKKLKVLSGRNIPIKGLESAVPLVLLVHVFKVL